MKELFSAKRLCRSAVIAALYIVLTYAFGMLSSQGFLQIRPAEALCILPLFYAEAIPALYVGCMLANIISLFGIYDVFFGSLATLFAAICTYLVGRIFRNAFARISLGGLFPILLNAFLIPLIIVLLYGDVGGYETATIAYWAYFASLFCTQAIWVYALGAPLYFFVDKMQKKNVSAFCTKK